MASAGKARALGAEKPAKVMIVRHGEKPDGSGGVLGVDETGREDPNQLSVRGWQRAGALVRFFAPVGGNLAYGIATPSVIFACKPFGAANSVRPFSTVSPLAAALGIPVKHEIGKRATAALLDAVKSSSGTVLICWSHKLMACILRGLAGDVPGLPEEWPANRFDLVWVLDRVGAGWSFSQVGQLLLPGDVHSETQLSGAWPQQRPRGIMGSIAVLEDHLARQKRP